MRTPRSPAPARGHFADRLASSLGTAFKQYNQTQKLTAERVFEGKPYYRGLTEAHFDLVNLILACLVMQQKPFGDEVRCIGDKTPRYTFHMDYLHKLVPTAKFIHVLRDGRDVAISSCYHVYRTGDENVFSPDEANLYKWIGHFAGI